MERFRILRDLSYLATARLGIACGNLAAVTCRGRIQLTIAGGSRFSCTGKRSHVGIPLKGFGSDRNAVTIVGLRKGSEISLDGALIGRGCVLSAGPGAKIRIGSGSYLNDGSQILANKSIQIGQGCAISWNVTIIDDDGHGPGGGNRCAPVVIEDQVWIGCNVTVLKDVTIGAGSIVAAGSVVTQSCPPRSLIAGVPARIIKTGVSWDSSLSL